MELRSLTLTNFKNLGEASLDFSPKINCFLGDNGMGKSNLLDAIHYLSFCRSFTGVADTMVIRRGEDFAMARGIYRRRGADEELQLGMQRGRRKSLKRAGKEYTRLADHIGSFPIVMTAPSDTDLARGAAEERRRWMDMVISQENHRYLDALMRYATALTQRNRMLRDASSDSALYEAVELQMEMAAGVITGARKEWIDKLRTRFGAFYAAIAGEEEKVDLAYDDSTASPDGIAAGLADALARARRRDEAMRHTTVGPHRDDIVMTLADMPLRRTASQGQTKTFTTALRLAQYEFLREATGMRPLLLLDDIFDKLDSRRVERIIQLVASRDFGQIFITDTNRKHLDEIVSHMAGDFRMWTVSDGIFTPER